MYTKAIDNLVLKLEKADNLVIHSCCKYPPLPPEVLAPMLKRFPAGSGLAAFYAELNGFQISYTFTRNHDFDKEAFGYYDTAFPKMWPNENYWHLDGCINILPLDFVLENDWKNYTWFEPHGAHNPMLAFEQQLLPFDVFSKDSIAVFHPATGEIFLGTDHNASYYDFLPVKAEAYLRGILKYEGLTGKREAIFKKS